MRSVFSRRLAAVASAAMLISGCSAGTGSEDWVTDYANSLSECVDALNLEHPGTERRAIVTVCGAMIDDMIGRERPDGSSPSRAQQQEALDFLRKRGVIVPCLNPWRSTSINC